VERTQRWNWEVLESSGMEFFTEEIRQCFGKLGDDKIQMQALKLQVIPQNVCVAAEYDS